MIDFVGLNCLLLILCAAGRLLAGKISRRLQYALWLLIPGYLLASRLVRLQGPAELAAVFCPQLAHPLARLEVRAADGINVVRAWVIESLTAAGILRAEMVFAWRILRYGAAAMLAVGFVLYNLGFMIRCIRRRRFYKKDRQTGLKIFVLDYLQTPFLLGRSIYVHPDMTQNEEFLQHAVCHEYSHYRQGDFLWTPLRWLFLLYYWFDPVVWLAVKRMERDSELSCDEHVISILGEDGRLAYGTSLITLMKSRQKKKLPHAAAMMGGKKSRLRERIAAISREQKRSIAATGIAVVCVILAAGYVMLSAVSDSWKDTAQTVFLWDGTGVEREDIARVTLYRFAGDLSYPAVDITEDVLNGREVPLAEPGRYMVIVNTKDHQRVEISDRGLDETAYSKGLLPSQVVNPGGGNP